MRKATAFLVFVLLAVTACGPKSLPPIIDGGKVNEEQKRQQALIVNDYVGRISALERVTFRIFTANTKLCADNLGQTAGMLAMAKKDVLSPYRDAVEFFHGVGEKPCVFYVVPGGPAELAGIQVGDVIQSINGKSVSDASDITRELKSGPTVIVRIVRKSAEQNIILAPVQACAYPVRLVPSQEINAMAARDSIFVFSGLLKFCNTEDELAVIMGHELAHLTMEHNRAKTANSILMSILIDAPIIALTGVNPQIGSNIGANLNSRGFEGEADYIGMYHIARAGYDIQDAAAIWRRMAVESPGAVTHASTHPTTAERFVALEAVRDEIAAKRAAGQELLPNMQQ